MQHKININILYHFFFKIFEKKIRNIIKTALNHNPSTEMKTATQSGSNEIKKEKLEKKKGRGLKRKTRNLQAFVPGSSRQVKTPSTFKSSGKKMKRVMMKPKKKLILSNTVFGFDIEEYLKCISPPTKPPSKMYLLDNIIQRFENNLPVYTDPTDFDDSGNIHGMYSCFKKDGEKEEDLDLLSEYHNKHTESIINLAMELLSQLNKQHLVNIDISNVSNTPENKFKTVYAGNAVRPKGCVSVLTNCIHLSKKVILKKAITIKEQQIMVIEALIHLYVSHNSFIPQIHFIGFTKDHELITCSEAVTCPSVHIFMTRQLASEKFNLRQKSLMLKTMILKICDGILSLQKKKFSHRDLHTSNVFWDYHSNKATIIDFDWSSVIIGSHKISVPRFLYDTLRPTYATNKSIDMCIFLRNVVNTLSKTKTLQNIPFFQNELTQIMSNYENECKQLLCRDFYDGGDGGREKSAAFQLYKKCTEDQTIFTCYSHENGIRNLGEVKFEYRQGYFEWQSMQPANIKFFIETGNFLPDCDFR